MAGLLPNEIQSNWQLVTSGIPQGLVLGPVLFDHFFSDLDDRMDHILSFINGTRLGGFADLLEGRKTLQRELDTLDWWAESNATFKEAECWALGPDCNNSMQQNRLEEEGLENCPAKKNPGVLVNGWTQANNMLRWPRRSMVSDIVWLAGLEKWSSIFTLHCWNHTSNIVFSIGPLTIRMILTCRNAPKAVQWSWRRD